MPDQSFSSHQFFGTTSNHTLGKGKKGLGGKRLGNHDALLPLARSAGKRQIPRNEPGKEHKSSATV